MNLLKHSPFERAQAYVAKIPGAVSGAGGHDQTFAVACALVHGFALPEADALALLRDYNQRCEPAWSERELLHKIESAARASHSKPRGHLLGSEQFRFAPRAIVRPHVIRAAPRIDPVTATENFLKGFRCGEVDLWEASPVRPPDDWTKDARTLLEHLYRPGEQINFVTAFTLNKDSKANPDGQGTTRERDALIAQWRRGSMPRSEAGGWMRMNPCNGMGSGKNGAITDADVTAFRFALVECDAVPLELQIPLLAKLPLPIAAILTSGGRSLHAWIKVDARNADDYRQTVAGMLGLLEKFGVDGKNKNPSRMSRLPGVVRKIGAEGDGRQRLLFLDPQPTQNPIL